MTVEEARTNLEVGSLVWIHRLEGCDLVVGRVEEVAWEPRATLIFPNGLKHAYPLTMMNLATSDEEKEWRIQTLEARIKVLEKELEQRKGVQE